MKILDNIKKARSANGFSQEYMAEKLGIATVNYGKIERGATQMTIDRLYQIAELLNVSVGDLLEIPTNLSNEEALKADIEKLQKSIAEQKRQLDMKTETMEIYKEFYLVLYKKSFIEAEKMISNFADKLINLPQGVDFSISVPKLREEALIEIKKDYGDFFSTLSPQDINSAIRE